MLHNHSPLTFTVVLKMDSNGRKHARAAELRRCMADSSVSCDLTAPPGRRSSSGEAHLDSQSEDADAARTAEVIWFDWSKMAVIQRDKGLLEAFLGAAELQRLTDTRAFATRWRSGDVVCIQEKPGWRLP